MTTGSKLARAYDSLPHARLGLTTIVDVQIVAYAITGHTLAETKQALKCTEARILDVLSSPRVQAYRKQRQLAERAARADRLDRMHAKADKVLRAHLDEGSLDAVKAATQLPDLQHAWPERSPGEIEAELVRRGWTPPAAPKEPTE